MKDVKQGVTYEGKGGGLENEMKHKKKVSDKSVYIDDYFCKGMNNGTLKNDTVDALKCYLR